MSEPAVPESMLHGSAAADPWNFAGESATVGLPEHRVTLVEETSFCLSTETGDIVPGSCHGLFLLDTRFLSGLTLHVDGLPVEALTVASEAPFAATFFGRVPPTGGVADGALVVYRHRLIGRGLTERIVVENFGSEAATVVVRVGLESDFADLFAVKERRARTFSVRPMDRGRAIECVSLESPIPASVDGTGVRRRVTARFSAPASIESGMAGWTPSIPPRSSWEICIDVVAHIGGEEVTPLHRCGEPVELSSPARRLTEWRTTIPEVETDHADLKAALRQTAEDLGALRIVDPEHPDDVIVAAGAPWYMTVFGRDSLLTAYMALIVDPDIALGVLRTLARLQGSVHRPDTEEQPGRILHEIRFHERPSWALKDGTVYYGTADATPLFVMLLGELRRWGLGQEVVDDLLPHVDRALEWIEHHGDRDGDGYVEYQRATPRGLVNQGWKDSWDAIRFADGRFAEGPIALCEVQGYVYTAYLARAYFADEQGDFATAARYRRKAAALKEAFNRDFWLEDLGYVALALDGRKRPVDALASNMGHCLWSGILDEDKAERVAAHLLGAELFSGWGVRTLGTSMAAYNPVSYHNGSVWPHDNALIAAGLVRYGFTVEAHRIIEALIDASRFHNGRLPELFSGVGRSELPVPAPYPTSCIPQAWSAASPLLFLRSLLRLDPWVPHGSLWVAPQLPASISRLTVSRIPLDEARISVVAEDGKVEVTGVPADLTVITEPRDPITAALEL